MSSLIHYIEVTDQYLYDFMSVEEILTSSIDIEAVNIFLDRNGGFILRDETDPYRRTHIISIWACHEESKWLTWICLNKSI
jgi:hypothetical protein